MEIQGSVFNGLSSEDRSGKLLLQGHQALLQSEDGTTQIQSPIEELRISPQLGQIPRVIEFTNGIRFESTDFLAIEKLERELRRTSRLHRLEQRNGLALTVAAVLLTSMVLIYQFGIPFAARQLAPLVPAPALEGISRSAEKLLKAMDSSYIIDLTDPQQQMLFQALSEFRDLFPKQKITLSYLETSAPNAFVLPNSHIYLTKGLIQIAESSDEILAVLLHEMGHHFHRHATQSLIESSALSILMTLITGGTDWSSMPILILDHSYSRDSELEADDFSIQKMRAEKKDPRALGAILLRMEGFTKSTDRVPAFLSTHPSSEDRMNRIPKAQPAVPE